MTRGNQPKKYPEILVQKVRELYASNMTQQEIAIVCGVTQKVVWNLMRRHGMEARVAAKRNQSGPANSSWKGDFAGKQAFHRRLYALYGKPCKCGQCGTSDESRSYDYANLTGHYEDLSDYMPMCRSCHWKYDRKIFNIKRMRRDVDAKA